MLWLISQCRHISSAPSDGRRNCSAIGHPRAWCWQAFLGTSSSRTKPPATYWADRHKSEHEFRAARSHAGASEESKANGSPAPRARARTAALTRRCYTIASHYCSTTSRHLCRGSCGGEASSPTGSACEISCSIQSGNAVLMVAPTQGVRIGGSLSAEFPSCNWSPPNAPLTVVPPGRNLGTVGLG